MTTTVRPSAPAPHYAEPSRLAIAAAPRLGMQPKSVEQLIHGHDPIHERMGVLLAAAVGLHDDAMVARLMAPIDAALAGVRADGRQFEELIDEAERADCAEEMTTKEYLRTRSPEKLKDWRRRIRTEVGLKQRLLAEMDALLDGQ